jgi:hypothetical protein
MLVDAAGAHGGVGEVETMWREREDVPVVVELR